MNEIAPEGKVWVCLACGKMSQDKYGNQKISWGWDESCMLNSALYDKSDLVIENNRVVRISGESDGGQGPNRSGDE
jgi:hypothetical protein